MKNIDELKILITSQEEQKTRGNLTPTGITYLDGLKTALKIMTQRKTKK